MKLTREVEAAKETVDPNQLSGWGVFGIIALLVCIFGFGGAIGFMVGQDHADWIDCPSGHHVWLSINSTHGWCTNNDPTYIGKPETTVRPVAGVGYSRSSGIPLYNGPVDNYRGPEALRPLLPEIDPLGPEATRMKMGMTGPGHRHFPDSPPRIGHNHK